MVRADACRARGPVSNWLSEQHIFRLIKSCKELTGRSDVSLDKEKNDQTLNCYLNSESLKTELSSRFELRQSLLRTGGHRG